MHVYLRITNTPGGAFQTEESAQLRQTWVDGTPGTRGSGHVRVQPRMRVPEGWLDGIGNSAKKRLAGNAVCSPQAAAALRLLVPRVLEALRSNVLTRT